VVEDNREVGRLQDLCDGGEPRVGGADGGSALQRIEGGQSSSRRQALIAFLQAFSTQTTNRSACMHFDGEGGWGIFFV
jgi:hypothetical protein